MEECRLVFRLCSLLLEYPQEEWRKEDHKHVAGLITDKKIKTDFLAFFHYLESTPFVILCENYVKQFDFRTDTTLYLTYGIFGDNRERGPALVMLKMEYAKAGFFIREGKELPDYLPLILEFASIAEDPAVRRIFLIYKKQLENLKTKLAEDHSPYVHLLNACLSAFNRLSGTNRPIEVQNEGNAG